MKGSKFLKPDRGVNFSKMRIKKLTISDCSHKDCMSQYNEEL